MNDMLDVGTQGWSLLVTFFGTKHSYYRWLIIVDMNDRPICMCQGQLNPFNSAPDGLYCRNCCRSISTHNHTAIYICGKSDCIYNQIAGQYYLICHKCYNTKSQPNHTMNQIQFIHHKFTESINAISYVMIHKICRLT